MTKPQRKNNGRNSKKQQPKRQLQIQTGMTIPRKMVFGNPQKIAHTTLKLAFSLQGTALVAFDTINIRNSVYQTISGYTSAFSGGTVMGTMYSACTVKSLRAKCTVVNATAGTGIVVTLMPMKIAFADHSTTYRDKRMSPECKTMVLGALGQFGSKGTIFGRADFSKLFGSNVTTTNNVSFIHNFGAAPATIATLELMVQSLDLTTVPSWSVNMEVWLDVCLQGPNQLFF